MTCPTSAAYNATSVSTTATAVDTYTWGCSGETSTSNAYTASCSASISKNEKNASTVNRTVTLCGKSCTVTQAAHPSSYTSCTPTSAHFCNGQSNQYHYIYTSLSATTTSATVEFTGTQYKVFNGTTTVVPNTSRDCTPEKTYPDWFGNKHRTSSKIWSSSAISDASNNLYFHGYTGWSITQAADTYTTSYSNLSPSGSSNQYTTGCGTFKKDLQCTKTETWNSDGAQKSSTTVYKYNEEFTTSCSQTTHRKEFSDWGGLAFTVTKMGDTDCSVGYTIKYNMGAQSIEKGSVSATLNYATNGTKSVSLSVTGEATLPQGTISAKKLNACSVSTSDVYWSNVSSSWTIGGTSRAINMSRDVVTNDWKGDISIGGYNYSVDGVETVTSSSGPTIWPSLNFTGTKTKVDGSSSGGGGGSSSTSSDCAECIDCNQVRVGRYECWMKSSCSVTSHTIYYVRTNTETQCQTTTITAANNESNKKSITAASEPKCSCSSVIASIEN